MTQGQRDITGKLRVLSYAQQIGNVSKACRYFGVGRRSFYEWKRPMPRRERRGSSTANPAPGIPPYELRLQ